MSDLISRQAAIRWVKMECNPYGKPTLDFESGKRVMKHLEQMPPAPEQPEIVRCKDCREFRRYINTDITFCDLTETEVKEYDFCSRAKKMEVEHE